MKFTKSLFVVSASALFLLGCGTSKNTIPFLDLSNVTPITVEKAVKRNSQLQEKDLQRWSHLDLLEDGIPGMSVDRAYKDLIKDAKGQTIIVGVIDSGIDIEHPDLASVIWTNPKEIADNGKDDDKNGYVDDVHGWNFLGDVIHENYEFIRLLKNPDDGSEDYKRAEEEYQEKMMEVYIQKQQLDFMLNMESTMSEHLGKRPFTLEDVKAVETEDQDLNAIKMSLIAIMERGTLEDFYKRLQGFQAHIESQENYHFNKDFDGRKIIGDNPNDINDTKYGNNNVIGLDKDEAKHGTHVAGIIAQVRHNGIGGDGIANNAKIMVLRAVPDGDEYDKDIALAIRYAADNGAKVINGSFGKYYSPQRQMVIDAMKYAAKKDVLIVIAAGNEAFDLDVTNKFPNDSYNGDPEYSDNVVIVGALNNSYDEHLLASFTNYGKKNVDVFAPGVRIYASTPNNSYEYLQGTSMASPNVAGVAALIRSYFPKLTASQVKQILIESSIKPNLEVMISNVYSQDQDDQQVIEKHFSEFSKSGGIVNAYNALIMASKMSKK